MPSLAYDTLISKIVALEVKFDVNHQENCTTLSHIMEFIDGNGREGAKSMLWRHETVLKAVIWAGAALVLGALGFSWWVLQQSFAKIYG